MDEAAFQTYLLKKKVDKKQATAFIERLDALQDYLKADKIDLDSIPAGKILKYTEALVANNSDAVLESLRALVHYGNFAKKYDYIAEILDIAEAYNAMDNLYDRVAVQHGEQIRDDIFADIQLPPLGVDPETKPPVTKVVMQRLEQYLGEEKTIALLAPCLHGRPIEPAQKDRELLLRLGDIDEFLKVKHQENIERAQQHQREGTLEYAQYVDESVVEYVKTTLTLSPGIREGTRIINTKMPYQVKQFLNAADDHLKRYYVCYCPWIRGAIKRGTEHEISTNFCYCNAGYTQKYWEVVFDQSVKVEPIETALSGSFVCKFATHIPKEFQK
jgi:hypothetical protein